MSPCRRRFATDAACSPTEPIDLQTRAHAHARRDLGLTAGERARNLGIILGCIITFALVIYLIRLRLSRHVESREHASARPMTTRTAQPAHINPAEFMRVCALREQRMQGSPRRLLKHDEIDGVAPSSTWLPTSTSRTTEGDLEGGTIGHPAAVQLRSPRSSGGAGQPEMAQPVENTSRGGKGTKEEVEVVMEELGTPPRTLHVSFCEDVAAEGPTCRICLEAIQPNDKVRSTLCSHVFHKSCLERWLTMYRGRCPLCQTWLKPGGE